MASFPFEELFDQIFLAGLGAGVRKFVFYKYKLINLRAFVINILIARILQKMSNIEMYYSNVCADAESGIVSSLEPASITAGLL